jgi:RHS repeat-associated protein
MYSPPLGRFLSRDPLPTNGEPDILFDNNEFGAWLDWMRNTYGYSSENPISRIDPLGLADQGAAGGPTPPKSPSENPSHQLFNPLCPKTMVPPTGSGLTKHKAPGKRRVPLPSEQFSPREPGTTPSTQPDGIVPPKGPPRIPHIIQGPGFFIEIWPGEGGSIPGTYGGFGWGRSTGRPFHFTPLPESPGNPFRPPDIPPQREGEE